MLAHRVFIGLGSNLDEPKTQLAQALKGLSKLGELVLLSPIYRSKAVGPGQQPDYLNAVAELLTHLSAEDLLQELHKIEAKQLRVRELRWGPRTIDLDILLFDDAQIYSEQLTIPHPQLCHRNFVIFPLCDIAPDLILPNGQAVQEIKEQLGADGLQKIPGPSADE